ncbi:AAA family ATPase [Exiguobacterium aurantiacum]|uniref:AAA family ATPase n=1 Tax=Exiguobacterium aurantiacum TaxID=33987 RepID=UPI00384CCF1B
MKSLLLLDRDVMLGCGPIANQMIERGVDVLDYMLGLVHATRAHSSVEVGVSPRGANALLRACQSYAYLAGRLYVIPEDVKAVAPYVLAHRISLTLEGGIKSTKANVIAHILDTVPVPVEG